MRVTLRELRAGDKLPAQVLVDARNCELHTAVLWRRLAGDVSTAMPETFLVFILDLLTDVALGETLLMLCNLVGTGHYVLGCILLGARCCSDFLIAVAISTFGNGSTMYRKCCHVCMTHYSPARLYFYLQYGSTHAAFAYLCKATVQHIVAAVDGDLIIFWQIGEENFLKMFTGSVPLSSYDYQAIIQPRTIYM